MLNRYLLIEIVESDRRAGPHVCRADAELDRFSIDQIKIDKSLQRRFQWCGIVVSNLFRTFRGCVYRRHRTRREEIRCAVQHG